jgi:hypothetical protein
MIASLQMVRLLNEKFLFSIWIHPFHNHLIRKQLKCVFYLSLINQVLVLVIKKIKEIYRSCSQSKT